MLKITIFNLFFKSDPNYGAKNIFREKLLNLYNVLSAAIFEHFGWLKFSIVHFLLIAP